MHISSLLLIEVGWFFFLTEPTQKIPADWFSPTTEMVRSVLLTTPLPPADWFSPTIEMFRSVLLTTPLSPADWPAVYD